MKFTKSIVQQKFDQEQQEKKPADMEAAYLRDLRYVKNQSEASPNPKIREFAAQILSQALTQIGDGGFLQ